MRVTGVSERALRLNFNDHPLVSPIKPKIPIFTASALLDWNRTPLLLYIDNTGVGGGRLVPGNSLKWLPRMARLKGLGGHRFSENPNPRPTGETVGTPLNSLRLIVNCVDLPPRQMSLDVPHVIYPAGTV